MPQRTDVRRRRRRGLPPGSRVLLVHRPAYDDWSFPKGKLDPGEHAAVAAVREVAEETGLHVRLGRPLASQRYPVAGGGKTVHYWVGWPVGDDDVSGYLVNDEIDEVVWVRARGGRGSGSPTNATGRRSPRPSRAAQADPRAGHAPPRQGPVPQGLEQDDRTASGRWSRCGHHQAQRLVALLAAYDVTRVASSSSDRCVQTRSGRTPTAPAGSSRLDVGLSRGGGDREVGPQGVDDLLDDARELGAVHPPTGAAARCSTRSASDEEKLDPAALFVVHHRKGRVVATEVHARP